MEARWKWWWRPWSTSTRLRRRWAVAGPGRASSRRTSHTSAHPAPPVWRPPRGQRGLAAVPVGGGRARAGLEIDHSERSSRVAISRAGRRPPAHTAARSGEADPTAAPGTPAAPHATTTRVHQRGRAPKYPPPCRLTQPLPRRGSGRMILSPGDGDASTGTCRPRRPLPGPLRGSGRRSRCGPGRCSAWWPGRRERRTRSSRR